MSGSDRILLCGSPFTLRNTPEARTHTDGTQAPRAEKKGNAGQGRSEKSNSVSLCLKPERVQFGTAALSGKARRKLFITLAGSHGHTCHERRLLALQMSFQTIKPSHTYRLPFQLSFEFWIEFRRWIYQLSFIFRRCKDNKAIKFLRLFSTER